MQPSVTSKEGVLGSLRDADQHPRVSMSFPHVQSDERPPLIALEGDVKNLLVLLDLSDLAARGDELIVSEILQRRRVDPRRLGSVALRAGTPSHESIGPR